MYVYDLPETPLPLIKRCCALFRTFGNKRLSDHVLFGLESLLPSLCARVDMEKIKAKWPAARFLGDKELPPTFGAALEETVPLINLAGEVIEEVVPEFPANMDAKFREQWLSAKKILDTYKGTKGCMLAEMYSRLGWECGQILRTLHDKDILWGTYVDDMGVHCNAHSNNFVIVAPEFQTALTADAKSEKVTLLAPLDFDMAFDRETFVFESSKFDEWKVLEHNGLRMALAGDPNISTGVLAEAKLAQPFVDLKWALR